MTAWLLLWRASRRSADRPRTRRTCAAALAALSLAVLVPLGAVYVALLRTHPIVPFEGRQPNGYPALVEAAKAFLAAERSVGDISELKPPQLGKFLAENQAPFEDARRALDRDCWTPLTYREADILDAPLLEMRALARAFEAEARWAANEGRLDDAVESHWNTLRVARANERGGLILHVLVGWAIERMGLSGLAADADRLEPEERRDLINRIRQFEATDPPLGETVARELAWFDDVYGWEVKLGRILGDDLMALDTVRNAESGTRAYRRVVLAALALRCYEAEHGRLPERLDELVPEYLPEVPLDPFDGEPLRYRADGDAAPRVYSIGPNRRDDGGVADPRSEKSDVVLDLSKGKLDGW
jgi:hypothetical protein